MQYTWEVSSREVKSWEKYGVWRQKQRLFAPQLLVEQPGANHFSCMGLSSLFYRFDVIIIPTQKSHQMQ